MHICDVRRVVCAAMQAWYSNMGRKVSAHAHIYIYIHAHTDEKTIDMLLPP